MIRFFNGQKKFYFRDVHLSVLRKAFREGISSNLVKKKKRSLGLDDELISCDLTKHVFLTITQEFN